MNKKKIIILTASIGAGHVRCAEAIQKALELRMPGADIPIIDCSERHISCISWWQKKIYLQMLALVPNLYDIFYRLAGGKSAGKIARLAFATALLPGICGVLDKYCPDTVICTHPFPAGAVALAKRLGRATAKLAVVLTDYSVHEIWLYREADMYFTATEAMQQEIIGKNFITAAVHPTGIPVTRGASLDKKTAREKLSVPSASKVILLMGGGLGLGHMEKTLAALENLPFPLTVLAVTGKNERLRQSLASFTARARQQIFVWGYTDEIPLLMAAADIVITKPGALTVSEAFAHGLPLVLVDPIPGPEADNARFAEKVGAALWPKSGEYLSDAVENILTDEDNLSVMGRAALAVAKPQAAEDIAGLVLFEDAKILCQA